LAFEVAGRERFLVRLLLSQPVNISIDLFKRLLRKLSQLLFYLIKSTQYLLLFRFSTLKYYISKENQTKYHRKMCPLTALS